jgi:hypothetical protein
MRRTLTALVLPATLALPGIHLPAAAQPRVTAPVAAPGPGTYRILGGYITGIDAERGTVRIRTDAGDEVDLPLPAEGAGSFRVGDRLDVQIELRPSAAGTPSGRPPEAPAP